MTTVDLVAAELESDTWRALTALWADLDAIQMAAPQLGAACRHAQWAFARAFGSVDDGRWRDALVAACDVLGSDQTLRSAHAAAARTRLAAFVAENVDLVTAGP